MPSSLLHDLKQNGKLRLDDPSPAVSDELTERAGEGIKAAKSIEELPSQAIPVAYFAAYHAAQAFFWRLGIRCETHAGSHALLTLFGQRSLGKRLRRLHERRWQAHYDIDIILTARDAKTAINEAEDLVLDLEAVRMDSTLARQAITEL